MPAFTADYFGPQKCWADLWVDADGVSFASVFSGPLYIARHAERPREIIQCALHFIAIVMFVSVLLPIIVRPPRRERSSCDALYAFVFAG